MNQTAWQKEWDRLARKEADFLRKGRARKNSRLNQLLAKKVPPDLQRKLDKAFAKAFELIFEKGTGIIEMTYDKDSIEESYRAYEEGLEARATRKDFRQFSRNAGESRGKSLLFSGGAGIGMGILGIGLPDIPIFTAGLLKGIYEIALHYGYRYDTPEEKYLVLRIIEVALYYGSDLDEENEDLNAFLEDHLLPENYDQSRQIRYSSAALSLELLYMKFLQGLPVVGAVGGAYDAIYMEKILKYADLKYHRRFLLDHSSYEGPDLA